ncbi:MAG: bifunctional glutamate N-acetyltransferase/amino-acid acetyltransferase ArgJ [Gammaproteobacteria bacterium]|nr:bifunctional glutamate N-acetyltransferase/amino-acid acetyltransferase ArgJ [Gammaproteobacteria bacterium]
MSTEVIANDSALPVSGLKLGATASGLRYKNRDDLCLIAIPEGASAHGVYTTNRFCAAPVIVARRHEANARPRFLVINAGNANAGTGDAGIAAALEVCRAVAGAGECSVEQVLPYSTGVIGQQLDSDRLAACVPALFADLAEDGWQRAAAAILTTDTRPKLRSATVVCGAHRFTVTGMTKGSGMIKPNMATMLAYVATDATIAQPVLAELTARAVARSFNRITVDGDTSTNDALVTIATGAAGNVSPASADDELGQALLGGFEQVCGELARDIVRDGEGATKFVALRVRGGYSEEDCARVAYAVAESPLVKTALFASDANWGRILAAVGRAGAARLDIEDVAIAIGPCPIVRAGQPVTDYDEAAVTAVIKQPTVDIDIAIGRGEHETTVWTCDLSFDYVKINAEYRS